jgi:hypothetical protein
MNSKLPKLKLSQKMLSLLQKWEVKCGWKELEMGNNFVSRHSLRF